MFLFVIISCKTSDSVNYLENDLNFKDVKCCQSITLNNNITIQYPIKLVKLDSVIILMDMDSQLYFTIFDLNGNIIKKFGAKGRGPGEILNPKPFCVNYSNKTISVFANNKLIEYSIEKVLNGDENYFTEKRNLIFNAKFNNVIPIGEEYYLMTGNSLRFAISNGDKIIDQYDTYPSISSDPNTSNYVEQIMNYGSRIYISPDSRKIIQSTYIGAILDIYNNDNLKISPINTVLIYRPSFKLIDKENITWDETTKIGFESISTSNDFIYSILNEVKGKELIENTSSPYTKNISIFDWNGNAIRKIQTDKMIVAIAQDEINKILYAISYFEGIYSLIQIPLI